MNPNDENPPALTPEEKAKFSAWLARQIKVLQAIYHDQSKSPESRRNALDMETNLLNAKQYVNLS